MKTTKQQLGKIALEMLNKKNTCSPEQTEKLFAQAIMPEYWQNLNPQLNICREKEPDEFKTTPINAAESDALLKKLAREGYFQTSPIIESATLERMCQGIKNLRRAGWHELTAFVYDEFWQVTREPSFVEFLSRGFPPKPAKSINKEFSPELNEAISSSWLFKSC